MKNYYFFTWEHTTPFGKSVYSDVCKIHPFIEINKIRKRLGQGIVLLNYKEILEYEYKLFNLELEEQVELSNNYKNEFRVKLNEFSKERVMLLNNTLEETSKKVILQKKQEKYK